MSLFFLSFSLSQLPSYLNSRSYLNSLTISTLTINHSPTINLSARYHPDDVAKAKANTEQLLKQLEKDATLRLQLSQTQGQSNSQSNSSQNSAQRVEAEVAEVARPTRSEAPTKTRRLRGMKLKDLRGGARV